MNSFHFLSRNFASLPYEKSNWDNAQSVVIPIPYDFTTTYRPGTRFGPQALIDASCFLELFDEDMLTEIADIGIHTLEMIEPDASGPESMIQTVTDLVSTVLHAGKFPCIIGGEHSISLGAVLAIKQSFPSVTVIQFDAHADLRNSYQSSPYNHACVARRIFENAPLVQIGIRSLCTEEYEFIQSKQLETHFYRDIMKSDAGWFETCLDHISNDVYITLDLDVLDPSIMPSVGTPEPGGMGWHETLSLLKAIAYRKNIVGFDVVELCPSGDNPSPDFLAARLVYKMLGYCLCLNRD